MKKLTFILAAMTSVAALDGGSAEINITIYLVDTTTGQVKASKSVIGKVEEVVDDDTGEVIDSEMTKLGTVSVTEVKEKVAYTTPLEGAAKGMGVHPAK